MTFELWLFTIRHLAQTYDATIMLFNQLSDEQKEALRKEYEETEKE